MTRTLLIGLDGATFTLLDHLMEDGVMPFLGRLTQGGVRAPLLSTVCPLTPPAWTTITTGRSPGNHGVFDFITLDDAIGEPISFRLVNGQDVLAEQVWSIAGRQGVLSAVFNFPATCYCPPFDGFLVPAFATSLVLEKSIRPAGFRQEIESLPGFDLEAISWDREKAGIALGGDLDSESFGEWVEYLIRKETSWFQAAKLALEAHACQLLCIVFEGMDRLQHQAWALLDPALRPQHTTLEQRNSIDKCLSYFRHVDRVLEQLVAAAGREARTFIVSDHGFGPTTEIFYANAWLERQGYLAWKEKAEQDREGLLTPGRLRDHFDSIDWNKTVACALTTSANGIFLRLAKEPGHPGVRPEDYHRVRDEIRRGLLEFRDPGTGTPVVTRVVDRDEAFPGRAKQQAPDLTLFLRDGGFLSILRSEEIVRPRSEIKGTHRPEGVLIAAGPAIRSGAKVDQQHVVSVAPTVLYSLGLPIPEDLEDSPMTELFEPAYVEQDQPAAGPPTLSPSQLSDGRRIDISESEEDVVFERLKALGYLE